MGVVATVVSAISGKKSADSAKKEAKRLETETEEAQVKADLAKSEALRAQAGESTLGSSNSKNVYSSLLGGGK